MNLRIFLTTSPKPHTRNRAAPGFTLIELLLVIGIIALMIAMLFPTLAKARESAREVKCLTHQRSIGQAIASFSADHKNKLPENRIAVTATTHVTWRYRMVENGYLTDQGVWVCPGSPPNPPRSEIGFTDDGTGTTCTNDIEANTALNGHILWRSELEDDDADRNLIVIARPSHTVLLAETSAMFPDLRVTDDILSTGWHGYWHQGQGTYAFSDGHAESIRLLDTGSPDCRWHNGQDLTQDLFDPQAAQEVRQHGHPNWPFLVPTQYR